MARKPVDSVITQKYGVKSSKYRQGYHPGTDLRAATGTDVHAPEAGIVTLSAYGPTGGYQVLIQGVSGTLHKLFHNSKLLVKKGDVVAEGKVVAKSGSTGQSDAPHCHWGTFRGTQDYDPMSWLAAQTAPKPQPGQPGPVMPKDGDVIRVTINRTLFKPGTDQVLGVLKPGGGYNYKVRGRRGYRVLVRSASAGGDGELALYYKNGQRIEGWS